ncbi:hypothetical protein IQ26_01723 [Mesorhizobium tianshanense]|uniref:Uncharacterized protein n=1 Tax=Mesorhizobium tianshanense TaxID=39844 RepID=A0A562P6R6_9HYPH|nr:hypothetical protein IQ26_01723 [Mesorhizobium tianshanense]
MHVARKQVRGLDPRVRGDFGKTTCIKNKGLKRVARILSDATRFGTFCVRFYALLN